MTPDLSSWMLVTTPLQFGVRSVAWTGDRFVAVGPASGIMTSRTGTDWTVAQIADGVLGRFAGLAGGNGVLVGVSSKGDEAVSNDGFEWSAVPAVRILQTLPLGTVGSLRSAETNRA
jgi:hypothetical protein